MARNEVAAAGPPGMGTTGLAGRRQGKAQVAWMEPVDAYRRLRAAGLHPVLLDGAGAHPNARYAFLACDPILEVRAQDGVVEERWADGAITAASGGPLAFLRRTEPSWGSDAGAPGGPPFTGGWVGFLGFGLANGLEPGLPAPRPWPGMPDLLFWLCPDAVVFDRVERTACVYVAACDGETRAPEERLPGLLAALATPAPTRPAGPGHAGGDAPTRWTASLDQQAFEAAVASLRRLVAEGDHFQANLATRFAAPCLADPADLFEALLASNPSPYMALAETDGIAIVSGSPEQLFAVRDGKVTSRPIAGTRKRGATPESDARMEAELRSDAKEQAEHTMLVDLVRNDVARVAQPGTVRVPEFRMVERYRHVMHLASRVEGDVRPGTGLADWVAALFPGGTVTGAPKLRATQRILEHEPAARGFYTGSAGYVGWNGDAEWSILIRTLQLVDGVAHVHAGAGIVADSDPEREWHEAGRKAQALLEAAQAKPPARGTGEPVGGPGRLGEVVAAPSWSPPRVPPRHAGRRVLLVDNEDSFVHNLADYCAALGAAVQVVRNRDDWRAHVAAFRPTHVILSPGPGWPRDAGCTMDVARDLHGTLPILGVCLGHQAIAEAHGGQVVTHPRGPVHGKTVQVEHGGAGLFAGLPSPLVAARYHSLVVEGASLSSEWAVDAHLQDGTVMAIRHRQAPTFGVQFHPESLCTPRGLELLDKFLETTA